MIFESPLKIDRAKTVKIPLPSAWTGEITAGDVDVLPLVDDRASKHSPGWCSYVYRHAESPELEVFCGGVNSKTVQAAALWRQGNLLHFGFESSPAEMNEAGRALLINSIAYIARFTEDRPITDVISPFVGPAPHDRAAVLRAFARTDSRVYLKYVCCDAVYKELEGLTDEERHAWYRRSEGYLHGDENAKLAIDAEAVAFGVPPNTGDFFEKAIDALRSNPGSASSARRLLGRYAPIGPGENASAASWTTWRRANKPYLFFSDAGGYRWYVDPLAKKRSVPTADLRGPARADTPNAEDVHVDEPVGHKPVAAGAAVSPSRLMAPGTAILLIRIRTAAGWHIYAVDKPSGTAQPTMLELSLPKGVEPDGDWVLPDAAVGELAADGKAIYEGNFSFRRRLKVTETAQPGELEVACEIRYQACDPFSCRPPETLRVEAVVEVVASP